MRRTRQVSRGRENSREPLSPRGGLGKSAVGEPQPGGPGTSQTWERRSRRVSRRRGGGAGRPGKVSKRSGGNRSPAALEPPRSEELRG
ncbi:hypothetical protein ACRRTK_001106 [Alexandromys fortis]